jgi:hypothetical protein
MVVGIQKLLENIAAKDAWVAKVRDIGNWWELSGQNLQSPPTADLP